MAKGNILKEAIADAKAVREVALQNAKTALEEAFTPKLNRMLSAKLSEELEDVVDDEKELDLGEMVYNDDEDMDEDMYEGEKDNSMDEEIDLEEILNELELEGGSDSDSEDAEEELEEHGGLNQEKPNYTADGIHKVTASEKNIYEKKDEFNLDILLQEINNLEDKKSNNKVKKESKNPKAIPLKTRRRAQVQEDVGGCRQKERRIQNLTRRLNETLSTLDAVKGQLNEVNLLNSKLLYVNRIFKANTLNESQKLRVVETLDKADSTKEAKLIYETIKDTFTVANTNKESSKIKSKKTKTIKESFRGMASKAAGTSRTKKTAPKRAIISESDNMVSRFQKLANIKISE